MKARTMSEFDRLLLFNLCRETCFYNILRTNEESAEVRKAGIESAHQLGYQYPEDALAFERAAVSRELFWSRLRTIS